MTRIKPIPMVAMTLMVLLSFTTFTAHSLSSYVIFIGVAFFFITKVIERQPFEGSGLEIKSLVADLKDRKVWIWLVLPLVMDAVSIILARLWLPEYIGYEMARAGNYVSFGQGPVVILQFAVFALGEEIAWRAFFQNQLCRIMSFTPVVVISSLLFALGHLTPGNPAIVGFNLVFIFINSILYGIVFHKSKNAWVSATSHWLSNLFSVLIMVGL